MVIDIIKTLPSRWRSVITDLVLDLGGSDPTNYYKNVPFGMLNASMEGKALLSRFVGVVQKLRQFEALKVGRKSTILTGHMDEFIIGILGKIISMLGDNANPPARPNMKLPDFVITNKGYYSKILGLKMPPEIKQVAEALVIVLTLPKALFPGRSEINKKYGISDPVDLSSDDHKTLVEVIGNILALKFDLTGDNERTTSVEQRTPRTGSVSVPTRSARSSLNVSNSSISVSIRDL